MAVEVLPRTVIGCDLARCRLELTVCRRTCTHEDRIAKIASRLGPTGCMSKGVAVHSAAERCAAERSGWSPSGSLTSPIMAACWLSLAEPETNTIRPPA